MKGGLRSAASIVLAILVLLSVYFGVTRTAAWFLSLQSDVAKAIVAAAATVIVSFITVLAAKQYEQRMTVKLENRQKRIPVYEEFVTVLQRFVLEGKPGVQRMSEHEKMKALGQAMHKMMVWASDDVVRALGRFRIAALAADSEKPGTLLLDTYEDLLLAVRRDLGHRGKLLKRGDLLRMFVNDYPGASEPVRKPLAVPPDLA